MNPDSASSAPASSPPSLVELEVKKPGWLKTLLRVLTCASAALAVIIGLAGQLDQLKDLLPLKYAAYPAGVALLCVGLKDGLIAFGDMVDNGVRDGSFTGLLLVFLLPCSLSLGLVSCATDKMSQTQLTLADIGYTAAQGALIVAEASLAEKMADPKTPAWQRLSAQLAVTQARKTLSREQAKLDAAFAALLAGTVPAELSMPTYTGGKTALSVVP